MVNVYIPKADTAASRLIDIGSGIVSLEPTSDAVQVYFEGNRYGSSELRSWEQKCHRAWMRMVNKYPTIATGYFPLDQLILVGTMNTTTGELHLDDASAVVADAINRWFPFPNNRS